MRITNPTRISGIPTEVKNAVRAAPNQPMIEITKNDLNDDEEEQILIDEEPLRSDFVYNSMGRREVVHFDGKIVFVEVEGILGFLDSAKYIFSIDDLIMVNYSHHAPYSSLHLALILLWLGASISAFIPTIGIPLIIVGFVILIDWTINLSYTNVHLVVRGVKNFVLGGNYITLHFSQEKADELRRFLSVHFNKNDKTLSISS